MDTEDTRNATPFFHPKPTKCKRCGFEFTLDDPPTECGECDQLTLCQTCATDHACCMPDACLNCIAKTTIDCINCPHNKNKTAEWLLSCKTPKPSCLEAMEKAQEEWVNKDLNIPKPTACGLCQSPDLKDLSAGKHYASTIVCNFCGGHWYNNIWRDRETWFKWIDGENAK